MGLNASKGNMYGFVTDTKNYIKGKCPVDCSYCYMKKWGELKPFRLDESEFEEDLGSGKFIFIGSSIDMWHSGIPNKWIRRVLLHIQEYPDNKYLFQSKIPENFIAWIYTFPELFSKNITFATTIETNRLTSNISKAPDPILRANAICQLSQMGWETMVTVEPILDFDLHLFVDLLKQANATQINVGSVTGGHKLPEPSKEKLAELIKAIKPHLKDNIKRLI